MKINFPLIASSAWILDKDGRTIAEVCGEDCSHDQDCVVAAELVDLLNAAALSLAKGGQQQ